METREIKTFSRRLARALRDGQVELIDEFLPKVQVGAATDFAVLKDVYDKVILEIGFGNGDFTAHIAKANLKNLYIGAEPFLNGVASLLRKIKDNEISNIRLFPDDVRLLLASMPFKYLDKVFIICPDPWPKTRHHKRRLVQAALLEELSRYLKEGATIEIVTDHLGYAEWILEESLKCQSLKIKSSKLEDHKTLPADWVYTKYQRRGLGLGGCIYRFILHT